MKNIGVQNFPPEWLPKEYRTHYDIFLLTELDGESKEVKCEVLEDLVNRYQSSPKDFKKLINTLRIQVGQVELLRNENKLKKYDDDKNVIEFKGGNCRLFGFVEEKKNRIIICTNFYWKTTGKKAKQNAAFKKAARLRNAYKVLRRKDNE